MAHSSDNSSSKDLSTPVAVVLNEFKDEILQEWVTVVKANIEKAAELRSPIIVNTIPVFLGNLAEAIDSRLLRRTANEFSNVSQEHGGERARITDYTPDQIIQEYFLLRNIILQKLKSKVVLDDETLAVIQVSFEEAIQKAMMAFHLVYNEIRENIITHLTHDMRTPLTAAKLSLDLILYTLPADEDPEIRDKLSKLVGRARKNIDYTNDLIQNILDEKHFKNFKQDPSRRFVKTEMMRIIERAIESFSEESESRLKVSGEKVVGYWEEKSLKRVAENIISNAIKYGSQESAIEIKICATHGRVLVSFHNKGEPISESEKDLLFNNFQRTDSAMKGRQPGWGLGLSYCREAIEDHKGSLAIESSTENGTTFTIDIPIDSRKTKL